MLATMPRARSDPLGRHSTQHQRSPELGSFRAQPRPKGRSGTTSNVSTPAAARYAAPPQEAPR